METQLSNLALRHLVGELQFLQNGFVNNAQTLENNWIKMKIHTKQGDKSLVLAPNAMFVANYSLQAKQSPGGFSAFLKKYLKNQRIISLQQHSVDRIVVFEFPEVFLIVEFFAKGNIVVCNREMKILRAMRKEEWKDRTLAQHEIYKFPSSKGANPLEESLESFEKKVRESKKSFFGACLDALNVFPLALETIFSRQNLDKFVSAPDAEKKSIKLVLEEVKKLYSAQETGAHLLGGVLYTAKIGEPTQAEREFEGVNAALNALLLNKEQKVLAIEPKENKSTKAVKEIESKKKAIEALHSAEKEAQAKGESIYLHYTQLKELSEALQKAKKKGVSEKETVEKINSIKPIIKNLDFKKKTAVIDI